MTNINLSDLSQKGERNVSSRKKRAIPDLSKISESYSNKTGSKLIANGEQTGSKLGAKTSSKLVANWEQTSSSKKVVAEKLGSEVVAEVVANWEQTSSKLVAKPSIFELSGLQKEIMEIIYDSCRSKGEKTTKAISIYFLKSILNTSSGTIKSAIRRLIKKKLIAKNSFKNGRGGWTIYSISNEAYLEMLQNKSGSKLVANWEQSSSKLGSELGSELVASSPSSSSYLINKTTTTGTQHTESQKWKIEIPENLQNLGFHQGHINQLENSSKFNSDEVQYSLHAFAYDMQFDGPRAKIRSPVAMFLALLKRGDLYASQQGYESDEEKFIRENLERLKKNKFEKEKMQKEFFELKFQDWMSQISDDEKNNLVPLVGEKMGMIHIQSLKDYFKENIFEGKI